MEADIMVTRTSPPIPSGCICSYTWGVWPARLVRNGALASCPADHAEIDGR
jgi:hypothetical protein